MWTGEIIFGKCCQVIRFAQIEWVNLFCKFFVRYFCMGIRFIVIDWYCETEVKPDHSKNSKEAVPLDELDRRVKELERRLTSVEQPLWKIAGSDFTDWNSCSYGSPCRCLTGTKSLNCWNNRLKSVPGLIFDTNKFKKKMWLIFHDECDFWKLHKSDSKPIWIRCNRAHGLFVISISLTAWKT